MLGFAIGLAARLGLHAIGRALDHPDKAAGVAERVADVARAVTGQPPDADEGALTEALKADPAALAQVQTRLADVEAELAAEETARAALSLQAYQADLSNPDPWVRRLRPTFGYCFTWTWALWLNGFLVLAAYFLLFKPVQAAVAIPLMIELVKATGALWIGGLSIMGVYTGLRSWEKKGGQAPGPLGAIGRLLGGGK